MVETRQKIQQLSDFQELRVKYILQKISKEEMAKTIIRKDKLRRKYTELVHIFELLSIVGIDAFRSISQFLEGLDLSSKTIVGSAEKFMVHIETKFAEYSKLREYCNSQLEIVSISFNQTVIQIDENFYMRSKKFSLSNVKKKMSAAKFVKETAPSLAGELEQAENVIVGAANVSNA